MEKKYIDAEKLIAEIERRLKILEPHKDTFEPAMVCRQELIWMKDLIGSLQQEQPEDMGEVSDGYHTFNELYYYRMLYNAAFFNLLPKEWVHKSKRHHTGEECFGGGWFIVIANLPTGQVSNHYELKDWDLFKVPEKEIADEWDGHTPQEAAKRLYEYLQQEQSEGLHFIPLNRLIQKIPSENWNDTVNNYAKKLCDCLIKEGYLKDADVLQGYISYMNGNNVPMATMDEQEQPECIYGRTLEEREKSCGFCSALCDARIEQEQLKVNLENEIEECWQNWVSPPRNEYAVFNKEEFINIVRHFFELRLNARKEE